MYMKKIYKSSYILLRVMKGIIVESLILLGAVLMIASVILMMGSNYTTYSDKTILIKRCAYAIEQASALKASFGYSKATQGINKVKTICTPC